jgi:hypothetical protein
MKISPNTITNNADQCFLIITANNVGKHPVHIAKAYVELSKPEQGKKFILLAGPDNFHTEELRPGLKRDFIGKQNGLDMANFKCAYVEDAVGRKFKCKVPREWHR